jgi:acetyl esterase/lipase
MTTTDPAVHDELLPLRDLIPNLDFGGDGLATMRAAQGEFFRSGAIALSTTVERADHEVSADPHVVVRVHRPVTLAAPAACVYSIHGGGYVIGSYEMDDFFLDRYCNEFGCVGVSVEYRFPTPPPTTTATPGSRGRSRTPKSSASKRRASASRV